MLKFLLLTLFATGAYSQTIYQCRGTNGRVTLQDQPCPDGSKTELSRQSIGQQNAEYRAQPFIIGDQKSAERVASKIICPSLRQQYQTNLAWSERAMLRKDQAEIQRAAEAIRWAGAQMSKHRCE
ncbi:DUF4124 domain-containing protein [Cupriavidus alkaliphilus]|uniref:DUF4124 domain-containing protein n=1 Tax=Cupriavidus alkaliphilus TaxID=942866 RepID=UPI00161DB08A|nr:DUF4124 domain-containing protein [Cupriavidus alkaliphilus]MBB2916446.1 hypothetical protein [Cupriavidus alkaliphilus]